MSTSSGLLVRLDWHSLATVFFSIFKGDTVAKNTGSMPKWFAPIAGVFAGAGLGYLSAIQEGGNSFPLATCLFFGGVLGGVAGLVVLILDLRRGR
jgi:hypothetical protein